MPGSKNDAGTFLLKNQSTKVSNDAAGDRNREKSESFPAVRARNFEGRLICCGVAIYIGFQTFINIGVVSWILPNTGVPLPFFSCGITSLLTLFIAMGIVLNVSLQRNVERDDDMFADDFRG